MNPSGMTENQRESFQRQLKTRAEKLDKDHVLGLFNVEYLYYPKLSFGKLFKGNDTEVIDAFLDAEDSTQDKSTLLVFSRPRDNVYVITGDEFYYIQFIQPILYLAVDDRRLVICCLEDYLDNVTDEFD